ncbi:bifunctional nicotinamidase/pyrazinamidase, partial [Aduncisulcus paluster]
MGKKALLIIDVQYDFLPGGSLAVTGGDKIIPFINELRKHPMYDVVVVSQDYHPKNHISFASTHKKDPFTMLKVSYGDQMMWPDHCVQGTSGCDICEKLDVKDSDLKAFKGMRPEYDSYSCFFDASKLDTGLAGKLKSLGVTDIDCVGLAYDYCVSATAKDGVECGFKVQVILPGTAAIDSTPEGMAKTKKDLEDNNPITKEKNRKKNALYINSAPILLSPIEKSLFGAVGFSGRPPCVNSDLHDDINAMIPVANALLECSLTYISSFPVSSFLTSSSYGFSDSNAWEVVSTGEIYDARSIHLNRDGVGVTIVGSKVYSVVLTSDDPVIKIQQEPLSNVPVVESVRYREGGGGSYGGLELTSSLQISIKQEGDMFLGSYSDDGKAILIGYVHPEVYSSLLPDDEIVEPSNGSMTLVPYISIESEHGIVKMLRVPSDSISWNYLYSDAESTGKPG